MTVEALGPSDIIEGATVRDRPKFYVLGCFDRRITFYSQQVRALSLVHALHDLGYLRDAPRIAVIGAGAAGLTAAAAAALASEARVVLFETSENLLPIQSATTRRKLDPHIYDWPLFDTTDTVANLPILDWEADTSRNVRQDVVLEFEDIAARIGARLEKRTRHKVKHIRQLRRTYEIAYDRLDNAPGGAPAEDLSDRFDMVFLAIGFGLEPSETVQGIPNASYWSDAGVPPPEFAARPTPRFLISGNGDGGLIDLVAAASRDFDHAAMIRMITGHAGINEIADALLKIDARARRSQANGTPFDIFAVYEVEIHARIEANGLLGEVAGRLRPGVQLTLQTNHPEIFNVNTSALNRLAAFATIKACQATEHSGFTHIHCGNVTRVQLYAPDPGQAAFRLDCDGTQVEADEVIIRRGPKRAEVQQPFLDILDDYEAIHGEWLKRHGDATLVPTLSSEARAFFEERANEANIPLSRRRHRQVAANLPVIFQLRAIGGNNIRWSGGITKENIAEPWNADRPYEVILPSEPADLGPVTYAILRMAFHARQMTLHADPAHWRHLVHMLSIDSPHASGMSAPKIVGGNPGGAAQNPETALAEHLARQIHGRLDRWVLDRLHEHLNKFVQTGADPRHAVGFAIAPDLREMMSVTWNYWRGAFEDDPVLLNRFLRLMVCAIDDDNEIGPAQVLVGPTRLAAIVRGIAVSLVIASSWQATAPKGMRPGNLRRQRNNGESDWSGHGCAAELINGKAMPLCAGSYMWQTNFVILTVQGTIELAKRAEASFAQIESGQPAFTETSGSGPVMMWISRAFSEAVEVGANALAAMLADVESQHFTRLSSAIQVVGEPA